MKAEKRPKLFLYKIWQEMNNSWDTYDSAVVCAASEEDAKKIHPNEAYKDVPDDDIWKLRQWADIKHVSTELVGTADNGIECGKVICASFNAG
jgi:hypothetical protein